MAPKKAGGGGKKPAAGKDGATAAGGGSSSRGVGAAAAASPDVDRAAAAKEKDKAAVKERDTKLKADCCKAFSTAVKKGNVKQGTKIVEALLKQHPGNPLLHFTFVRISHKLALESRQPASLKKQFKECGDRAAAALGGAPTRRPSSASTVQAFTAVRGSCGFVAD